MSDKYYIVWLGGMNGAKFTELADADAFAQEYLDEGYDDITIEVVHKIREYVEASDHEQAIDMVLSIIQEMKDSYDYHNPTLDELAQRIM